MLNLRDLQALRALVTTGTTKAAAASIGVSQPTLSRAIVEVESHFGRELFTRQHGRLVPTAAALRISETMTEIGAMLSSLHQELSWSDTDRILRIGMSRDYSSLLIQGAMRRLKLMHPGITLRVQLMGDIDLSQEILNGAIDVGLCGEPHLADEIEVEKIVSLDLCCIIPPNHRLKHEQYLTPALLAGEPLIRIQSSEANIVSLQNAFRQAGVEFTHGLNVSSTVLACEFVASGMGVALCAPFNLGNSSYPIIAKPFLPSIECKLFCVMPRAGLMHHIARQFARLVRVTNETAGAQVSPPQEESEDVAFVSNWLACPELGVVVSEPSFRHGRNRCHAAEGCCSGLP